MADRVVSAARSRVILIGVARYDDPELPDLPSGNRSAEDLARTFEERASGGQTLVETVLDASRDEFVHALVEAETDADDQLILYFSGHAVLSQFGELVLATRDFDSRDPELTGMSWNSVRRALARTSARSVVAVLDCCFNGAADSAWQESRQSADASPTGTRGRQFTYLMAGRAPWPYQPGVLGAALRSAIDAVPVDEGSLPDFTAAARRLRDELIDVSQPKLMTSGAQTTTIENRVSPVFVSYRIEDSGVAVAVEDVVTGRLGRAAVFRSTRTIAPGQDFADVIEDHIRQSRVVVAVIGPGWEFSLTEPHNWMVDEIATALENEITVVPLLVGARTRLQVADLPQRIHRLAELQSLHVPDATPAMIDAVVKRLLELL